MVSAKPRPIDLLFYDSIKLTLNIEGCVVDEQPVNRNFVFVFTLDAYDVGTFSEYSDSASCHTYGRLFTQQRRFPFFRVETSWLGQKRKWLLRPTGNSLRNTETLMA